MLPWYVMCLQLSIQDHDVNHRIFVCILYTKSNLSQEMMASKSICFPGRNYSTGTISSSECPWCTRAINGYLVRTLTRYHHFSKVTYYNRSTFFQYIASDSDGSSWLFRLVKWVLQHDAPTARIPNKTTYVFKWQVIVGS